MKKVLKWLNIVSCVLMVLLFCVTLDPSLLFIALGNMGGAFILSESGETLKLMVGYCSVILCTLGYLVFTGTWFAFALMSVTYVLGLLFLRCGSQDIDKLHLDAS